MWLTGFGRRRGDFGGEECEEVVFDFRKTVFMDSSGIGLVMGRFREMELIGGKVRAVHVGERMRRILVMSGVTRVIEVEEEKTWK